MVQIQLLFSEDILEMKLKEILKRERDTHKNRGVLGQHGLKKASLDARWWKGSA